MPLDVVRLRDSDLTVLASGEAFRAAVLLWCASWHQMPAASIPNDERILAKLAGYGRDVESWAKVRDDALHGFVECSDGRLYHPVVAEKALEADDHRKKQRERTLKATEARRGGKRDDARNDDRIEYRNGKRGDNHNKKRRGARNEGDLTGPNLTKTTTESSERVTPTTADEPPAPPSETLSAKAGEVPEGKPVSTGSLIGKPLPSDWTPNDQLCEEVKSTFGMTDADLQAELPAFHALNAQRGTFSNNWDSTFQLFCKRWKEHRDKQAAPRAQLNRMPGSGDRFVPGPADWDKAAELYGKTGRWPREHGPDPMSPACKCPVEILRKHGINEKGERRIPSRKVSA
ncbi:hypothetical protein AYJ54_36325 [Bradyrhizobium centrolobii]|uniref:DUF1376 domain-containing protein n=2 Tax=Bradyrhizobium centrolobii TaxID=1505087 RepID=A0A176Y7Y6_9BRAD|nr:hypothetical protein AYJ54_36325 [Bradyrhizobium centrolobii]